MKLLLFQIPQEWKTIQFNLNKQFIAIPTLPMPHFPQLLIKFKILLRSSTLSHNNKFKLNQSSHFIIIFQINIILIINNQDAINNLSNNQYKSQ